MSFYSPTHPSQQPRPPTASSNSSTRDSSYFTANDHLSSYSNSFQPTTNNNNDQQQYHSSPSLGHGPPPPQQQPFFNNHNPTRSPDLSFKQLDSARPYPLIERRSFREVSSSGDILLPRGGEEQLSLSQSSSAGAWADATAGGGSSSRGRNTPTIGGGGSSVGAIGDGRKVSGVIGGEMKKAQQQQQQQQQGDGEGQSLTGLGALFDGRSALGWGALSPSINPLGEEGSTPGTSRPSSFILDVLPARTDQARDRAAGGGGSATGSLSLDTRASPSTTRRPPPLRLQLRRQDKTISDSSLFHSPTSTSAPLPPTSTTPIAQNNPLTIDNNNNGSTTRSSSPARLDSVLSSQSQPSSTALENLTNRVNSLESSVTDLSSLLSTEVRSLRDEVGVLRGLVLKAAGGAFPGLNGVVGGGPQSQFQRFQQQQQQHHHPIALARQQSHEGTITLDSPLLTLRSPSPPLPTALSTSAPSASSVLIAANGRPTFPSSSSALGGAGAGLFGGGGGGEDDKDEQIRLLTAQVANLSSSVAHLSANANASQGGGMTPTQLQHLQQQQQQQRQFSLPNPTGTSGGAPGSTHASPALSSLVDGWKRDLPSSSPGGGGGGTGLGMSGVGGGPGGGGGIKSPMMRPVSSVGLSRTGSLGGVGGAFGRQQRGSGETFDSSSAGWGDVASSPLLGGGGANGGAGASSPLLGSNPPGSLGGKWEALGVGNELFRTIAKYGLGPPTKIQSKAIPCILRSQDIVAQAPSIQERIQSYVVPALQLILSLASSDASTPNAPPTARGIQILIVTATVDQAAQAQRLFIGLGGSLGIRTSLCVGASNSDLPNEASTLLKSPPHVLVGTPQKLLDLFALRTVPTNDVRLLVVDECDQLIARNLAEFVGNLVRLLPPSGTAPGSPVMGRSPMLGAGGGGGGGLPGAFDTPNFTGSPRFPNAAAADGGGGGRQTAILSCTVPQDVLNFASSLQLREPVRVLVRREGGDSTSPTVRNLKQYYVYIAVGSSTKSKAVGVGRREASNAREWKLEALADLCEDYAFDNAVIFCSSVDAVEAVSYKLGTRAIETLALHQDMGQSSRHAIMTKFRSANNRTGGGKKVLVVYDALCRTLTDVPQVPLVLNFDLPRAVEDYVHRITCATASGYARPGVAINIVTPGADVEMLRSIEAYYRCKIAELPPSFS
ncbi:hypothetical protein BCR35DRAFT_311026 [Leucosporidium creatinivorum]|uniref:ATP-dependent RNA helicase n=1 Tax=Leucosporidium creatinivorum TaxID=106004 RepID=A0A1Y2CHJ7_9BASI|nr:hypothetical protein BCR35DRAFT_311026 [Leucosporidium creatinivorum]